MVGAGIILSIAAAGYIFYGRSYKAQMSLDLDQKLNQYHGILARTIQQVEHCNATFFTSAELLSISPPADIRLSAETKYSGLTAIETVPAGTFAALNQWIDEAEYFKGLNGGTTRTWRIIDFSFPTSPEVITSATPDAQKVLSVTYELNPAIKSKTIVKKIPLKFRFDASNRFIECLDPRSNTVLSAQFTMCDGLNPDGLSPAGSIARWNPQTQRCELLDTGANCLPGTTSRGLDVNGELICMPTDEGVETRVPSSTATTCSAGQSMKLNYSGGVLAVECL